MIKNFKPRLYQQTILATAAQKNTLVVLPTGMGKTNVFLMLAAQRLKQYPNSKILLLGPTRPLIDQYLDVFEKYFKIDAEDMQVLTGQVSPDDRAQLWEEAKIVFSTPQGLENDVLSGRISLENVSLLGFDEAHKGVGNYAYVWVAEQYMRTSRFPRIIGMTASPGSDAEKIKEICDNLFIEEIEVRTDEDPDVKPYVQETEIRWIEVELPHEFKQIKNYLEDCIESKLKRVKEKGYLSKKLKYMTKIDMLKLQGELQGRIAQGEKDFDILKSISLTAEAIKTEHALGLLETQGILPLYKYMKKIQSNAAKTKTKAVKNLANDLNFRSALYKTETLVEKDIIHPKLEKLMSLVKEMNDDFKIIVFSQFRDTTVTIKEELEKIQGVKPKLFVGQTKKNGTGMSQKKQKQVLDKFRDGEFNALISTQIGEEGLDIPKVDLVVFYEPVPSAIRFIQRKGRTGRQEKGEVIVLIAKNTRDVAYKWSAHHKKKRMYRNLKKLSKNISLKENKTLDEYIDVPEEEKVTVFADYREKGSGCIKELIRLGVDMKLEKLKSGDYLASENVGVELKNVEDFVNSLVNGRLLSQLRDLRRNFEKPLVIVEGSKDIYSVRNVHPNALRGLMSTIAVDYNIPIIFSRNPKETAAFLKIIAEHEQKDKKNNVMLHGEKKPASLREQQEYLVSSIPGIGSKVAIELLKTFGSVKNVFGASEDELMEVKLVGKKTAESIRKVIDSDYKMF